MRKWLITTVLALAPFCAYAQDACEGTMKPLADVRAAGITVEEVTPRQRANIEANIRAKAPDLPNLTHAYVLTKGDNMILALISGENCVVHAGQIDQENLKRLEKEPAGA